MAIDFSCACGQKYSLPEALAGKTARCKKCSAAMTIPSPFAAREAIQAVAEGGGHAPAKKIDDVEVVEAEQSKAVVAGEPPVVVTPEEESEGAEPAAPLWCEGYYDSKNAQRFCRIYRAGDELLFLDAGPRFSDKREVSTRAGGAAGGVIGAAIGLAAGSIANKLTEGQKEEAKKRKRQLDAMLPQALRDEAETGDLNRLWRCAEVTLALFEPPSLFEREPIQSILHLSAREAGQFKKTKIYIENFDDHKAAAAVLRAALGKDNVRVDVPTSRKKLAKYDAKRLRKKRMIQWSLGGVAAVIILLALIPLLWRKPAAEPVVVAPLPDGNPVVPAGGAPQAGAAVAAAVPGGFVLIDAPVEVQQVNKDIDKQKEHARRVKKLAQEAPPFDPAEAPSMRSTLTDLLVKSGGEHWIAAAEQRLKGGAGGVGEQDKFLDKVLQGQLPPALAAKKGVAAVNAVSEQSQELWNPIPIDAPTAPFKLSLTTGIPFEINPRGAAFDTIVMKGPYYVSFPWWLVNRQGNLKFDLFRDPKNKNRYIEKIQQHYPPHKVIDLRDGKPVGEFDWRAPVWANARLSPDGKFLVGNDSLAVLQYIMSSTATAWDNGKDTVFIWAQGKKTPTSFKVPGVVDWMDFVGNDRLAYVTYAPKTVMRIHDVAKNAQVAEIELPGAAPAQHPDRQNDDTPVFPTLEFYRPMARRGAVSANGKYVALGCQDGVRLISIADGKVVGLLPVDGAKWYRSLNFSADGARLFGVIIAVKKTYGDVSLFRSWSVATGQSLEDLMVDRHETGPVYPGPVDGLYLATKFIFTRQPLPLDPAPFRILRLDDDGTALVAGSHQQAPPGTPQTESLIEKMKGKQWRPDEIEVHRKNEWALFTVKLDWSPAVKKIEPVLAVLRPRPAAKAADRAGVVAQKPKPPEVWTPPSFVPAPEPAEENDDVHAMHQFGAWPISFGDEKAAIVRYVPKTHYRKRWQVWLDLVDRNTGKRGAPAAKLWDWAHFPDQVGTLTDEPANPGNMGTPRPLPPIGALRPDAELFALVDPSDARRVDVFKTNGERLFGFIPVNDARIDWLGWSRTNLLTVAAGRLTAWEPTSGKAVFEVDGDYTRVGEVSPDRKWVALWTGKYADILDIETGKCLGRCQAGGFSGTLLTFNLSPDAKHLVASFTGWPKGLPANGPGNTAVVWNFETGKAGLYGFAGDRDQRGSSPAQATCAWVGNEHLLLCGGQLTDPATLIDLRLEMSVGTFRMSGGGYVAGQPAVTGPDGRIWYATSAILGAPKGFNPHVPDHPDFPAGFVWHTVSLPGFHGKDAFLADAKREFVELLSQPVQVQAKLGTKRESEALARAAARTLQANGLRIGPGGTVLRVQGALEDTEETISFIFGATVKIPRCNMLFQWLSEKDAELWKHKSTSTWSMSSSRYKVSEKQESFGVGGVRRYEFDFKGQNPSAAMREELLESLTKGGPGTLQLPNLQFLRVNGEDHPVPVSGTMVVRLPPSAPGKKLR